MSVSAHETSSRLFVNRIIIQDSEILAKMYGKVTHVDEMYQLFRLRLSLFEQAEDLPLTELDRLLLDSKKTDVIMELKLFRFKQHIEEQLSQVISRLDALEVQLSTLKEKQ
jgi:hypothetical protein